MAPTVEQLQRDAADPTIPVGTILQKAILVANEHKDQRFADWLRRELNGYGTASEDAEYRNLKGQYVVLASDGRTLPIVWDKHDPKLQTRFITLPLVEMEALLSGGGDSYAVTVNVDPRSMTKMDLEPGDKIGFLLGRATLSSFLHVVRQRVLDWTMNRTTPPQSPQQIRRSMLQVVDRLQGDSLSYADDSAIANELKLSIQDVRGHLGILEREGQIKLNKTMHGHSAGFDAKQRQSFRESPESELTDPPMRVMAFDLHDPLMLRTLTGLFPLDGSIAWQRFGRTTPDECEGVRLQFSLVGRVERRRALQIVLEKCQANKVSIIERRGQVWRLDLDGLREGVPDLLAGLDWASGTALVEPEIEVIPGQDDPFGDKTIVRFSIYKEEFLLELQQKIFLSHKGADKPQVRRFFTALKTIGFDPWLDEDAMTAGTELERGILKGFKDSCAAVFFITPNFVDEGYLATEVNYAIAEKRAKGARFAIITIVFTGKKGEKGVVPELLKQYVWKEPATELEALNEILRALPIEPGERRWKV